VPEGVLSWLRRRSKWKNPGLGAGGHHVCNGLLGQLRTLVSREHWVDDNRDTCRQRLALTPVADPEDLELSCPSSLRTILLVTFQRNLGTLICAESSGTNWVSFATAIIAFYG